MNDLNALRYLWIRDANDERLKMLQDDQGDIPSGIQFDKLVDKLRILYPIENNDKRTNNGQSNSG